MDPVAVFNALYDTKCLKFGRYDLKSGLVAPYYINLRRLPLYPKIMEAVVGQVVDKYLSNDTLKNIRTNLSIQRNPLTGEEKDKKLQVSPVESDADSQLDEEEEEDVWIEQKVCYQNDPIICGVPYGAVPLAAAIAYKAKLPYLFERKESKSYGDKQSLIDDFRPETEATDDDGLKQKVKQSVILIEDVICSGESILDSVRALERQQLKVEFVICIVDREENGINLLLEKAGIHVLPLYNMSAMLRILETTGRITNDQFMTTRQWMQKNQFKSIGIDPTIKIQEESKNQQVQSNQVLLDVEIC